MKLKFIWIGLPVLSILAIAGVWILGIDLDMSEESAMTAPASQNSSTGQPLYWVAPMDANYRRSEPGLSPMGMPLIPVYESSDTITVSSSIQQNLGVRTEVTVKEDFSPVIDAVGYTGWDESSIHMLHTRAEGWLEVFNLASVGDRVNAGDVIYELFAPNLVSVQREYLTARESGNGQLAAIAKDRLFSLGFTQVQVDELDRTATVSNRLSVRAERNAIVTHIGVREGNYVEPKTAIATFASLDSVWIETEVFESMADWIEPGLPALLSFAAFPGESWATEIAYIYPNLESTTRSLRLRLVVANTDQRLRPNMFATVKIESKPKLNALTVSREAVIRAGEGDRVIVALDGGQFRPQVVRTGVASGSRIEIVSGLSKGDRVVTSGQFLLDSEANVEQAFARLEAATSAAPMAGMAMPMAEGTISPADNLNSGMPMPLAANQDTDSANVTTYSALGEIRQIAPGASVTISHGPVSALAWPAMTMAFQIPPQMNVSEFAVSDLVVFEFVETPEGSYQLSRISLQVDAQ